MAIFVQLYQSVSDVDIYRSMEKQSLISTLNTQSHKSEPLQYLGGWNGVGWMNKEAAIKSVTGSGRNADSRWTPAHLFNNRAVAA